MKKFLLIAILSCFSQLSFSQNYKTAIGFKGGFPYYGSLDIKHDFGNAFGEFRVGGYKYDFFLQGLYEKNFDLSQGFEWYWGIGAHLGFWNYNQGAGYYHDNKYYDSGAYGGIDGVLGLEYTFDAIPLNLAVDAGPAINVFPYVRGYFGAAVALRFAIK
jgi:hypothetical protein